MTNKEMRLLRDLIKMVLRVRKQEWWLLKREIWDRGYQNEYYELGQFIDTIEKAVFLLSPDVKMELMKEWKKFERERGKIDFSNFNTTYTMYILEEIQRRASIAAMKTSNWDELY